MNAFNKNIPQIRFPGFTGEWVEKKLGDVRELMKSGVSRLLNDSDVGLPVIRSNNLNNGQLNVDDIKYWYLKDDQGVNLENYYLNEGDLLVNFINSIAQIGKVAMFKNLLNRDTIYTTNIMRLTFKENYSNKLIYYYFNTKQYSDFINTITKPAVNQASFTTKDFDKLNFFFPTLPEQEKIADFISDVDSKIEKLSRKKELMSEYKKGVMQKIFSQEIRFKDQDGIDYPDWEEKKLGEVCTKFSERNKNLIDAKVYSVTNYDGFVLQSDHFEGKVAGSDLTSYKIVQKSDFAYNPARINVGSIGYFEDEIGIISSLYVCFRTKPDLRDDIMKYILQLEYTKFQIRNLGEGGVRIYLWFDLFALIRLKLPCLEEQKKIAEFLTNLDKKIEIIDTELEAVKEFKKGLLQTMFV